MGSFGIGPGELMAVTSPREDQDSGPEKDWYTDRNVGHVFKYKEVIPWKDSDLSRMLNASFVIQSGTNPDSDT